MARFWISKFTALKFMKISFALFAIQYLRCFNFKFNFQRSIFLLAILFITSMPIIIQPDLGTGLIYIIFGIMLLFICGMDKYFSLVVRGGPITGNI